MTSSRADYCHLYWPLRDLQDRRDVAIRLIVMGSHLSPAFGHTVDRIKADGFDIAECVDCLVSSDTDAAMATSMGTALIVLGQTLSRLRPDLLVLIADRYEMLAPASAAIALRIPLVHIEGGELSEGVIDQVVRNALSAMSHVHLTTTEAARDRLVGMGEEPWRVHRVGAPSLDHFRRSTPIDRPTLESQLDVDLHKPTILAAYHPVTLDRDPARDTSCVLSALESRSEQIVLCHPNADSGRYRIVDQIRSFCARRTDAHLAVNLDPLTYWSLLRHVALLYGNSSSGIMETPTLGIPAVNIGRRQQGRERAPNVIDVAPEQGALRDAIERGLSDEFRKVAQTATNPYGDGHSAARIVKILTTIELDDRLLEKRGLELGGEAIQVNRPHVVAPSAV